MTPLDPFEAQRLLVTLMILTAWSNEMAAPTTPVRPLSNQTVASRPARGRRHVRPARSC